MHHLDELEVAEQSKEERIKGYEVEVQYRATKEEGQARSRGAGHPPGDEEDKGEEVKNYMLVIESRQEVPKPFDDAQKRELF